MRELLDPAKVQVQFRYDTDFGFVVVEKKKGTCDIEVWAMVGLGRYELLTNLCGAEENELEEAVAEMLEENEHDISAARLTKKAHTWSPQEA